MNHLIEIEGLRFSYNNQDLVLDIPSMKVETGKKIFIYGPSGCGKSTFLNLISGVLFPQEGTCKVLNSDLMSMNASERDRFRGENLGYIFQNFNLVPYLNAMENILLPLKVVKAKDMDNPVEKAKKYADVLGISHILGKNVNELSIGQQQRVAAARSLMGNPKLIVADEPTSALDYSSTQEFMKLLVKECEAQGATLLFVSHDERLKEYFDESLDLTEINKVRVKQ